MKKRVALRTYLEKTVPGLDKDPERLFIAPEKGHVVPRAGSVCFEYREAVTVTVLEVPVAQLDGLVVALLFWIQAQQPELLRSPHNADGLPYTVDMLDRETADISFQILLSEVVSLVGRPDGSFDIIHRDEPDQDPGFEHLGGFKTAERLLRLYLNGEHLLGPPEP